MSSGKDSVQVVGTPWEFIRAVEKRWGSLDIDLAASKDNAKAPKFVTKEEDSLKIPWGITFANKLCWLNPDFGDIAPWAEKCYEASITGNNIRIFLLVPASVDSNWWAESVHDKAVVLPVHPRIKFIGSEQGYPKPLALCLYGFEPFGSYPGRWVWM